MCRLQINLRSAAARTSDHLHYAMMAMMTVMTMMMVMMMVLVVVFVVVTLVMMMFALLKTNNMMIAGPVTTCTMF